VWPGLVCPGLQAEPGVPVRGAIGAVLELCGPTADKPLLLLGGVLHRRLVSVDDLHFLKDMPVRACLLLLCAVWLGVYVWPAGRAMCLMCLMCLTRLPTALALALTSAG
jgi:hypothetical protein